MAVTERHKRPGGFRKLVNSLEVTSPERRAKILDSMRAEDSAFVSEVEACIFNFEEFKGVQDMALTDILSRFATDARTLAIALYKCKDEELLQKFQKCMPGAIGAACREELSMLDKITVGVQQGARFKIIEAARTVEREGLFTLKRYSPNYAGE